MGTDDKTKDPKARSHKSLEAVQVLLRSDDSLKQIEDADLHRRAADATPEPQPVADRGPAEDPPESDDAAVVRRVARLGLFTADEIRVIASWMRVAPAVVARDVLSAVTNDERDRLDWFRAALARPHARFAWEARRLSRRSSRVSGEIGYKRFMAALEAGEVGVGGDDHNDPDALVLASDLQCGAAIAIRDGGDRLLRSEQDALEEQLREGRRRRHARREQALDAGIHDEEIDRIAWCLDLETTWARDGDRILRGISARDEALVRIGRMLHLEQTEELSALRRRAQEEWEAYERWMADANWSPQDTELLAEHQGSTFREAAVALGNSDVEQLQRFRRSVERQRDLFDWTQPDDVAALRAYWGISDWAARERIGELLDTGEGGLRRLREARSLGGAAGRARYHAALASAAKDPKRLPWRPWDAPTLANTQPSMTAAQVEEMLGGLMLAEDRVGLQQWRLIIDAELGRGHLPKGFVETGLSAADAAEIADREQLHIRTVIVDIAHRADKEPSWAVPTVADIRAIREAAGRGPEACLRAFAESPTWWDEDAQTFADLRGAPCEEAKEYIGHRLLASRPVDLRDRYIETRIEEQGLARVEDTSRPYVVLVLQGGGAKAAYQVGIYEALRKRGLEPSWVLGISSGALNAAVITGNPSSRRLDALDTLWSKITNPFVRTRGVPGNLRSFAKIVGVMASMAHKPNFYRPHGLPPALFPSGTQGATSLFTTQPLQELVQGLVDFDRIAREGEIHCRTTFSRRHTRAPTRLTLGTTEVSTGRAVWFDNVQPLHLPPLAGDLGGRRYRAERGDALPDHRLSVDHILASAALPPGAPGVLIDGKLYWDGGVVGNNPLEPVLDEMIEGTLNGREVLVVLVDLWASDDWEPRTFHEVKLRTSQLDHTARVEASLDRFRTRLLLELERRRVRDKGHRGRRRRRARYGTIDPRSLHILRMEDGRRAGTGFLDPMDFSAASIAARRSAGASDMERALDVLDREAVVDEHDIGGVIHQFRRGVLLGKTEAVDVAPTNLGAFPS